MAYQQAKIGSPPVPRIKRSYVRKGGANSPDVVFPTSPPQLSDLAFNIHGWALEDGMIERDTFEVINAYKATMVKGGFEAKIQELKTGTNSSDIYRNELTYTVRERDESLSKRDSAVSRYLVVGYSLQEDDPIFVNNKTFARYSENELVGESRPAPHHLINWSDCRTPMLVVTPVKENTGTSVRLFALIMPKSGLCQPVLIQHERIFYRWEFRASAGARSAQRNKNWNQLVVEKARLLTPPGTINYAMGDREGELERSIKRSRSEAAIKQEDEEGYMLEAPDTRDLLGDHLDLNLNLSKLFKPSANNGSIIDLDNDMTNSISAFKIELSPTTIGVLTAIRTSKTDRVLKELRSVLEKVDSPRDITTEISTSLLHFSFVGSNFGRDEAIDAANEIITLWPQLQPLVDVDRLLRIKTAMERHGFSVGAEVMEKFFSDTLAYLVLDPHITDEALPFKINEMIQIAIVLYQARQMKSSRHHSPVGMDAVYLITLLQNLLQYHNWESRVRGTVFVLNGPAVPPALSGQTFEYYVNFDIAQKVDELENTVEELHANAKAKNCGLGDILLWLERLRLQIRQA